MDTPTESELKSAIRRNAEKAKDANADEALKHTQAALNAANALETVVATSKME